MVVLSTLLAANPSYRVYSLRHPYECGIYSAIVTVKKENITGRTGETRVIFEDWITHLIITNIDGLIFRPFGIWPDGVLTKALYFAFMKQSTLLTGKEM